MELQCKAELGNHLRRNTQRARVISEAWFGAEGYCLNCSSGRVAATVAGTEFRDFECPACGQPYELKSSARAHTSVVQDGGFDSMMRRIRAEEAPALMLMHYSAGWQVQRLVAVHPVFLTSIVVRKRAKPHIRPKSGAEYWMCDLDLTRIPADGKIAVVTGADAVDPAAVRAAFAASKRFAEVPVAKRGWTGLVLDAVRKIGKTEFTLAEVYAHEAAQHAAYPGNSHVRDKMRQQLQVLRDLGYLEFAGRGQYRVLL